MTTNQPLSLPGYLCPFPSSPPFSHAPPCQLSEAASEVSLSEMLDEEELGGEEGSDSEQEKDGNCAVITEDPERRRLKLKHAWHWFVLLPTTAGCSQVVQI